MDDFSKNQAVNSGGAFINDKGYPPAPENISHIRLKESYGHFIGGCWVSSSSGETRVSLNPANGERIAEVAEAGQEEVDRAVSAARQAYDSVWRDMPAAERAKYIYRIARLIQERAREFAVIESLDGGKPVRESRDVDVPLAANHFFYYAGWADKLDYAFPGREVHSLGVVAQVVPWNFPLLMAAWKIAPALACGNTVVLKPAETTPLTALKLAEVIDESGLPAGVVNIITGGGGVGEKLVQHPDIDKVAFTGSTAVGKQVQRSLAGTDKKYTLELGGKAAQIIFEDAPIEQAVEGVINGIFFNQGHVCCAGSRLYVQEPVAERVIQLLKRRMNGLVVGDPLDKNTDVGAINSAAQLSRIEALVESGREQSAVFWQSDQDLPDEGYWFRPTLFTDCAQSHRVMQEEIFGPVLAIQTFRTPGEAIDKANNTPYGLSGGVWTDKGSKALAVTREVRAGVMWINSYNQFDPCSPFGGFAESGVGREGGLQGLAPYVHLV